MERQVEVKSCKAFRVVGKNLDFALNASHWKPLRVLRKLLM